MTAGITDPELALYGMGDTIADRLAREVRELRAKRAASREMVREAVLLVLEDQAATVMRGDGYLKRGTKLRRDALVFCADAIASHVANADPESQRAENREQVQHLVRGIVLDVLGPCNDWPQIPDDIADRVADALAAPKPVLDAARVREVVRAALSEWMGAYHDTATPFDAARVSEAISTRAAEQLVGQHVGLNDQERAQLVELLHTDAAHDHPAAEQAIRMMLAGQVTASRGVPSPERAEVDRVARILIAEWRRVEHKPVNISYVATFADMARAVVTDRGQVVPGLDADDRAALRWMREFIDDETCSHDAGAGRALGLLDRLLSAPSRVTLDAQQQLDLQRMRADYEHALGRAQQRATKFPGIQDIADGVAEYTRWVALLDHLLFIFGGTQT